MLRSIRVMELKQKFSYLTNLFLSVLLLSANSGVFGAPVDSNEELVNKLLAAAEVPDTISSVGNLKESIICKACAFGVDLIQKLVELDTSEDLITDAAIKVCKLLNIQDDYICDHIVPEFKTEVLYVFANTALSPTEICGTVDDCGSPYDPFNQTWTLPIPSGKPPVKPIKLPPSTAPTSRILHLSDIHVDPQYTPGLSRECGEPLCCRPPNKVATATDAAGLWGEYNCDVPYRTFENLLQHLNSTADQYDWVYVTGDFPAHNDWTQTRDDQIRSLKNITNAIKMYLPGKPVYYAVGNHESAPVNSFPPPSITDKRYSESWLLDVAAQKEYWGEFLDDQAIQTLRYGGFYSMDIKPDLRIISLQTNFCSKGNWWLLINSTDPGNMLQWLIKQLLDAESKNMKVHILGHIPPGEAGTCMKSWSWVYHKIVWRFESTIIGQFFGHVHQDRFEIFLDYDGNPDRPMSVSYLGPSVTPYTKMNPGYRIYHIDGTRPNSTRIGLYHETFYLNLTDANLTNKPKWLLEYNTKKAYNMSSLLPQEWLNLVLKMYHTDDALFQKFYHFYTKMYDPKSVCRGACKYAILCTVLSSRTYDSDGCKILHGKDSLSYEELEVWRSTVQNIHC